MGRSGPGSLIFQGTELQKDPKKHIKKPFEKRTESVDILTADYYQQPLEEGNEEKDNGGQDEKKQDNSFSQRQH
jgi:hypothetical protein